MRLDAMCCEVSLSRWIEPGRLTVALWYQRLRGRGEGCSLVARGLKSQSLVAAFCCLLPPLFLPLFLLVPTESEALLTIYHLLFFGLTKEDVLGFFPYRNDLIGTGIEHVNKWLGRSYMNVIKMHLFDRELGLVRELRLPRELCCTKGLV